MAGRPPKETVDWFPHDANASEGKTLTILQNRFGNDGYSVWFRLLERISSTRNHIVWQRNSEDREYLAARLYVSPEKLTAILDKLAELHAIDPDLYKRGAIWCGNLVNRVASVYSSRGAVIPARPDIKSIVLPDNAISSPNNAISSPDNAAQGLQGLQGLQYPTSAAPPPRAGTREEVAAAPPAGAAALPHR